MHRLSVRRFGAGLMEVNLQYLLMIHKFSKVLVNCDGESRYSLIQIAATNDAEKTIRDILENYGLQFITFESVVQNTDKECEIYAIAVDETSANLPKSFQWITYSAAVKKLPKTPLYDEVIKWFEKHATI